MCCSLKNSILISLVVLVLASGIGHYLNGTNNQKLIRDLIQWSDDNKIPIDKSTIKLTPFKVAYDEQEWNTLVKKLELSRYITSIDESQAPRQEFGMDPEFIKEMVDYWKKGFNWQKSVEELNRYPQFKIEINGTIIHFVRVKIGDSSKTATPLLIMDGWPGSYFGFYESIDHLKKNLNGQSYDIIIPTYPGLGHSTPLNKILDPVDVAQLFDAIMRYHHGDNCQYYIHGEDWGSTFATVMAQLFPKSVLGIHITMPVVLQSNDYRANLYLVLINFAPNYFLSPEEIAFNKTVMHNIKTKLFYMLKVTGYFHIQATLPDSFGQGFSDSPSGLLAYLMHMYSRATFEQAEYMGKKDGALLSRYSKDELLKIATYYWMTNCMTSSMRMYKNYVDGTQKPWPRSNIYSMSLPSEVAVGVQYFKNEVFLTPLKIIQVKYPNLIRHKIMEKGGHFAAFENPELAMDDFIAFIESTKNKKV